MHAKEAPRVFSVALQSPRRPGRPPRSLGHALPGTEGSSPWCVLSAQCPEMDSAVPWGHPVQGPPEPSRGLCCVCR